MLINKIGANRKVAWVLCLLRKEGGVLNSRHWGLLSPLAFSFLGFPLALSQYNGCVSCSWADPGNQTLHGSLTILPREITHLELKPDHKLLGSSDCYRYKELQKQRSTSPNSAFWRRGFCFRH